MQHLILMRKEKTKMAKYTKTKHDEVEKKLFQIKTIIESGKKISPDITPKINGKLDLTLKLTALNTLIGYLVRKGADSELPMEILIDIANDYEKRLKEY